MNERPDPIHKAFTINLNRQIYGAFSEIGAGQEVARYFFRAGGASGTIAKSMSAYDMAISDDIYGKAGRYVSCERVQTMLDKEFHQLQERLDKDRGEKTCFFSFANTVAAKSFQSSGECHGWLGMFFQHLPRAKESQILLHVRMLDKDNLQQQEALGIVGTNLIYNCYYCQNDRARFVQTLMDNLSPERLKIDFIDVQGPAFSEQADTRLWPLELVKNGYCEAVMFNPTGAPLQSKDALYQKNILLCRGSYRPPTLLNLDMLQKGKEMFGELLSKEKSEEILTLPEISMNRLRERGAVDSKDFLARIELLGALGYHVLISSFKTYGALSSYISQCTKLQIAFIMGHYNLGEVFADQSYQNLPGGMLEGIGILMGHRGRVFIYPAAGENGQILAIGKGQVESEVWPLIDYLKKRGQLFDVKNFDPKVLPIWSRTVIRMIQENQAGWEAMVPSLVAQTVKKHCLFDYSGDCLGKKK